MHGRALREHHRRVYSRLASGHHWSCTQPPFTIASGRCIIIYECWRQLWQAAATKKDASVSNYFLIHSLQQFFVVVAVVVWAMFWRNIHF